jgi:hypothetical protein
MVPTHNKVGLRLLIGPRRIQGLALEACAYGAVPECSQVRIVGPALGVCCGHRCRQQQCRGVLALWCCGVIGIGLRYEPEKCDN